MDKQPPPPSSPFPHQIIPIRRGNDVHLSIYLLKLNGMNIITKKMNLTRNWVKYIEQAYDIAYSSFSLVE